LASRPATTAGTNATPSCSTSWPLTTRPTLELRRQGLRACPGARLLRRPWSAQSLVRSLGRERGPNGARRRDRPAARPLRDRPKPIRPEQLAQSPELPRAPCGRFRKAGIPGRQTNAIVHLAGHDKGGLERATAENSARRSRTTGSVSCRWRFLSRSYHGTSAPRGTDWARSQTYLRPYPKELGLRGVIPQGAWTGGAPLGPKGHQH
jgi:hypothetical protein